MIEQTLGDRGWGEVNGSEGYFPCVSIHLHADLITDALSGAVCCVEIEPRTMWITIPPPSPPVSPPRLPSPSPPHIPPMVYASQ